MILNALVLSVVTFIGMVLIFYKLPPRIRAIILKFDLVTDIGCAAMTYAFLGGTATAIIAAGLVGIYTSLFLPMLKGYIEAEKESKIEQKSGLKKIRI